MLNETAPYREKFFDFQPISSIVSTSSNSRYIDMLVNRDFIDGNVVNRLMIAIREVPLEKFRLK